MQKKLSVLILNIKLSQLAESSFKKVPKYNSSLIYLSMNFTNEELQHLFEVRFSCMERLHGVPESQYEKREFLLFALRHSIENLLSYLEQGEEQTL